ncbi:uncharacterized protein LOC133266443 [Pezoporus flaviventris]|uniref:uncharacterized protein LOC133266443 n=1 Tax=Pezoporus flaviventris TaxID=889875 RepID=UPI002AAF4AC7|nr:uncharacterized protein LOC133266443 [Pezoporus flaviventris]
MASGRRHTCLLNPPPTWAEGWGGERGRILPCAHGWRGDAAEDGLPSACRAAPRPGQGRARPEGPQLGRAEGGLFFAPLPPIHTPPLSPPSSVQTGLLSRGGARKPGTFSKLSHLSHATKKKTSTPPSTQAIKHTQNKPSKLRDAKRNYQVTETAGKAATSPAACPRPPPPALPTQRRRDPLPLRGRRAAFPWRGPRCCQVLELSPTPTAGLCNTSYTGASGGWSGSGSPGPGEGLPATVLPGSLLLAADGAAAGTPAGDFAAELKLLISVTSFFLSCDLDE